MLCIYCRDIYLSWMGFSLSFKVSAYKVRIIWDPISPKACTVDITEETCIMVNRAGICMYLPIEHIGWMIMTVHSPSRYWNRLLGRYVFSYALVHIIDLRYSAPYASRQCSVGR